MLDTNRLAKNKKDLLDISSRLSEILSADRQSFLADPRNALSVRYLLIEAVEAIADTCQHLLAKTKGAVCDGYVDCILKAGQHGIISGDLTNNLRRLADLRNHLIHRYWIIDDARLYDLCREHQDDIPEFADQADGFLARAQSEG